MIINNKLMHAYEQAARAPETPFWIQLASGLGLAGLKLIPSRFLSTVGPILKSIWSDDEVPEDPYFQAGFILESNHCRGESHEIWQSDLGDKYKGQWVIPIDEIVAMAHNDPHACDFIHIQRLLFKGTEAELAIAINKIAILTSHHRKRNEDYHPC